MALGTGVVWVGRGVKVLVDGVAGYLADLVEGCGCAGGSIGVMVRERDEREGGR